MDATFWVDAQVFGGGEPMMLQLVNAGYDVWMGNNRATRYSNDNTLYPNADNPSHPSYSQENALKYDFSWFEMGVSDLPAMIDKVLEITKQPKLTYIGYSQGTSQMFYGLTQKEDSYFADRLNKAIFLAPCVFS
jgi:pimeloyl-ACP methyl ester carboxylesterase